MAVNLITKAPCFVPRCFRIISPCCIQLYPSAVINVSSRSKITDPKFKKEQPLKIQVVALPGFDEERKSNKLSVQELRVKLKEKGIAPHRKWNEKPIYIGCTGHIFEPYVPPQNDGEISPVTSSGMKQVFDAFGKESKSYLALRRIFHLDYEFDVPTVAENAKDIYTEAQKALAEKNEDRLHDLVTERAYSEMMENTKRKTIVWNLVKLLEPPRIVQVRMESMISKVNFFAQVTVRLYSQQTLAVYDRFGRLMHGSEDTVKDVLEYIVFEKHISDPYGTWRIHGKIFPDQLPPRDAVLKRLRNPDVDNEFPEPPEDESSKEVTSTEVPDNPLVITA